MASDNLQRSALYLQQLMKQNYSVLQTQIDYNRQYGEDAQSRNQNQLLLQISQQNTSLTNLINSLNSSVQYISSQTQPSLPIGTILMYDSSDWVDNQTIPGWYACTALNNALNNHIPDLEGNFIRGISPETRANKIITNNHLFSGKGIVTLTTSNLPPHSHNYADRINTGGGEPNVNGYNAGGSDAWRTTDGGNGLYATPVDLDNNISQYAVIYIKKIF
ncbi:Conserved_hypothetical protein [Hexamita inflata]|uniref:Tail fiber protein n=1 Tax=Hexamita inflata TaxID=28002 RepID=A0AA86P278_9EUKA|nr:Conserved hypothetical protein [Hexamita inflata]CAI9929821.1 Conserved hypothetical protein [Hexamita inflata]CAI9937706.1 Conserved hypothetical protein [Hexamita inflata]